MYVVASDDCVFLLNHHTAFVVATSFAITTESGLPVSHALPTPYTSQESASAG